MDDPLSYIPTRKKKKEKTPEPQPKWRDQLSHYLQFIQEAEVKKPFKPISFWDTENYMVQLISTTIWIEFSLYI